MVIEGPDFSQDFEAKLDYLLERREDLNNTCGLGGTTILHALILHMHRVYDCASSDDAPVHNMLTRGADPDVSSLWGTPLQFAWRKFRRYYLRGDHARSLVEIILVPLKHGPKYDWEEPNGTKVDKETIERCIAEWRDRSAR